MGQDLVELNRCRSKEGILDTTEPLEAANIPYKKGSTAISFDLTKIGTGDDPEVIISVRKQDYAAARAVLEKAYGEMDLPDDHYLANSADEDLAEILANPDEWNPYDVVHARRLAEERDLDPVKIIQKKQERVEKLREGKPAPKVLLIFGWVFSFVGVLGGMFGIAGIGVAWSLCFMKEKTEDGVFHTFNSNSRAQGACMFCVVIVFMALTSLIISR